MELVIFVVILGLIIFFGHDGGPGRTFGRDDW